MASNHRRALTIVLAGAPSTGAAEMAAALAHQLDPLSIRIAHALSPDAVDALAPDAALILLMGLDSVCSTVHVLERETMDARLRAAIQRQGMAYQVVYGQGHARVQNALNAIENIAKNLYISSDSSIFQIENTARQHAWNCEICSDAACERHLFTALMHAGLP